MPSADFVKQKKEDGKIRFSEPNRPFRFASDKKVTSFSMVRRTTADEDDSSDGELIPSRPNSKGKFVKFGFFLYQPVT